jgi:hypothetical protein
LHPSPPLTSDAAADGGFADPSIDPELSARARQYDLETSVLEETVKEYSLTMKSLMELGQGASLTLPKRLMVQWFGPLCEAIDREQAAIWDREQGYDRQQYGPFLILLPPEKLAVITMHEVLSLLLHMGGSARLSMLATRVGEAVQAEVNMTKLKYKDRRAWSNLAVAGKGEAGRHVLRRQARNTLYDSTEWSTQSLVKVGGALIHMLLRTAQVEVTSGGRLAAEALDPQAAAIPFDTMARQVHSYYSKASHPTSHMAARDRGKAAAAASASAAPSAAGAASSGSGSDAERARVAS